MSDDKNEFTMLLKNDRFSRSEKYDIEWVLQNNMGPNALWLTEWLCEEIKLKPGMRILDMGCGKALSSVFLAKEFGVQVWANDLWISANENWQRIRDAGLENQVYPIRAEAHALPYAEGFFDAIVCLDAYIYFGTDDLYLASFQKFVRPGGQIGIVVPGLVRDFNGSIPEYLTRKQKSGGVFWSNECWCFHTAEWWRNHWAKTGLVDVELADTLKNGWQDWLQFEKARNLTKTIMSLDEGALELDGGRYLGLVRMVGRRIK